MIGWVADGLTAARTMLAVGIAALVADDSIDAAALVLAIAWLTDALDGPLARHADAPTRLGDWDMPADVSVGAGMLVGLGFAGTMPLWLVITLLIGAGGGFIFLRSPALGMILQAVAYGVFLWRLWSEGAPTRWVPVAVAGTIGVLDFRRLTRIVLPEFFRGVSQAVRLHRGSGLGLPDRG